MFCQRTIDSSSPYPPFSHAKTHLSHSVCGQRNKKWLLKSEADHHRRWNPTSNPSHAANCQKRSRCFNVPKKTFDPGILPRTVFVDPLVFASRQSQTVKKRRDLNSVLFRVNPCFSKHPNRLQSLSSTFDSSTPTKTQQQSNHHPTESQHVSNRFQPLFSALSALNFHRKTLFDAPSQGINFDKSTYYGKTLQKEQKWNIKMQRLVTRK